MEFIIGLVLGAVVGYVGAYFQHKPEKWAELTALFKKKPDA